MKSLFEEVEGKYGEDLTTSILKYLLTQEKHTVGFDLFKINLNARSSISTQKKIPYGRFDLFIEDENTCVIIENKFFANFTYTNNKNQLARYYHWLSNETYEIKKLIVLTIKRREREVEAVFNELNSDNAISKEIVLWENVVSKLNEKNDVISNQLAMYVFNKYLQKVQINKENIEMFSTVENALTFNKILQIVDKIHDYLKDDLIDVKRTKYEEHAYGFYFKKGQKDYWFGFDPVFWEKTGICIDLQYRTKILKDNNSLYKSIEGLWGFHYIFSICDFESDENLLTTLKTVI